VQRLTILADVQDRESVARGTRPNAANIATV
jgi:hypothetical protein